jgi:type VI protein secretion system component VasK
MTVIILALIVLIIITFLIFKGAVAGDEDWSEEELRNLREARKYEREQEDKAQIEYIEEYMKRRKEKEDARKLRRELHRRKSHRNHSERDES